MPPTAGEATTSIWPKAARALRGERAAQAFGAGRILEDEHLLQEDRRTQARGENEVALEKRASGAKFVERLFWGEIV